MQKVAVIGIGSNSVRMLVALVEEDGFTRLTREEWIGGKLTRAVVVVECPASRIDDIIVEIHDMGLEMVTIHDRPEGSRLGTDRYIIEIENGDGVTDDMAKGLAAMDGVRFLGRFDPAEKRKEP